MVNLLSWLGVGVVLVAYAAASRRRYDIANLICSPFIAAPALIHHIYQPVIINAAFSIVAAHRLWRTR